MVSQLKEPKEAVHFLRGNCSMKKELKTMFLIFNIFFPVIRELNFEFFGLFTETDK